MATWAYSCRPCVGEGEWMVARAQVDPLPPEVTLLRVKVGGDWRCARVDRRQPVAVDAMLLREAEACDLADCPECAPPMVAEQAPAPEHAEPATTPAAAPEPDAAATQVHAAAISLQGQRFVVVLVGLDVVRQPGEADMLAADLSARFGGVEVVLMGQQDDGTPEYHGAAPLLELLADLPVDKMPWKAVSLR